MGYNYAWVQNIDFFFFIWCESLCYCQLYLLIKWKFASTSRSINLSGVLLHCVMKGFLFIKISFTRMCFCAHESVQLFWLTRAAKLFGKHPHFKIRRVIDPVCFFFIVDRSCEVWIVDRSRVVLAGGCHSGCIYAIYLELRALWKTSSLFSEETGRGENLWNLQHCSMKMVCHMIVWV